ncbi:MAG: M50 family metallopeptidase [archaeon]
MPIKSKAKSKPVHYVRESKSKLNHVLLLGILFLVFAIIFLLKLNNEGLFWLLLVVGAVLVANSILLRFSFATPFMFKYILTMLKTKHFVNFITSIAHHAKWFEKICILGSILGFGVTAVDYWFARKIGGWKRILLLLGSAVVLGFFFYTFCKVLFAVPVLAPLFWFCLIAFVILGFGGMSLAILVGYGGLSVISLINHTQICPSVAPVLPGVPIPGLGVAIPLIAWISFVMVLVIHEFSHGIMMIYYKEKIKSVGVILAGIIPFGAFVEQDNKTFEKLDDKKALNVLSAGSASNLFTLGVAWVVLLILITALVPFNPVFEGVAEKSFGGVKVNSVSDTVSFCGVDANAPAKGKLFAGDIVKEINGVDINSIETLNKLFKDANGSIRFTIERTNDKNIPVDLNVGITPFNFEQLGIKRIGVEFAVVPTDYVVPPEIFWASTTLSMISQILLFFIIISFAAGSFNYFPSEPFDGGKMAKIILAPYFGFMKMDKKDTHKLIGRIFVWILIISLTLNMIPYLTMAI